jgi:glyoxylase-like metal-dependent hydrolase (beta-lactamase superfamily II)
MNPSDELQPGRLVRIGPTVQRLVAPNASLMTGPGTNSYVIGEGAVLDPGPDDPAHLTRLRESAPHLRYVFVTHTHRDHSCGARALATQTGAAIVGLPPPADGLQDMSCVPDIEARHDTVFELEADGIANSGHAPRRADAAAAERAIHASNPVRLRVIHTPGHASNHVCYLLTEGREEGLLFSGDHVLEGVTPVILPPDGDMAQYLDSLERLKGYGLRAIAPGHGHVIDNPVAAINAVIAHRGRREAKVLAVLSAEGRGALDELLPRVYDDVKPELLPIARKSLEAHLIKLRREGRAGLDGDSWLAVEE